MRRAKGSREHISTTQPAHLEPELTRGLLGRWLQRGDMIAQQHRALGRRILEEPNVTVPRRTTDPHDPSEEARQLRGIPVVGVPGGMGGAMKGTRPGDGLDDYEGRPVDTTADDALPCDGQLDAGGAEDTTSTEGSMAVYHPPTR